MIYGSQDLMLYMLNEILLNSIDIHKTYEGNNENIIEYKNKEDDAAEGQERKSGVYTVNFYVTLQFKLLLKGKNLYTHNTNVPNNIDIVPCFPIQLA